jgi:CubicO group peptidase (beta-lactamase class C family)
MFLLNGVALAIMAALGVARADKQGEQSASGGEKPDFAAVKSFVTDEVQSGKVPSLALAVSRHGRILWEDAFGFANKESQVLATPHTRYHLASVPKTFTAAAIMKLQERGALKLDDPVNRYLGKAKL